MKSVQKLATGIFLCACALLALAEPDPLAGTWELVLSESEFEPGPPPQSQILTYTLEENGLFLTVDTVDASGESSRFSRPFDASAFNGEVLPVDQERPWDSIVNRRPDPFTYETAYLKDGEHIGGRKLEFSEDGQSLVITARIPVGQGEYHRERAVYRRIGS